MDQHTAPVPPWAVLILAGLWAAAAQLARELQQRGWRRSRAVQVLAGAAGAGIAGVAFTSIALDVVKLSAVLSVSLAGVVGWVGGNAMIPLAAWVERKFGLNVLERDE